MGKESEVTPCPKCRSVDFSNCHSMRCPMRVEETPKQQSIEEAAELEADKQNYDYESSEGNGHQDFVNGYIAGAKSQAAKEYFIQQLFDHIEMNRNDWCRTPLVMTTKFRDEQFKQEKP